MTKVRVGLETINEWYDWAEERSEAVEHYVDRIDRIVEQEDPKIGLTLAAWWEFHGMYAQDRDWARKFLDYPFPTLTAWWDYYYN